MILANQLKTAATEVLKVADTVAALERERDYYRDLSARLAKMVETEHISYADRTEIALVEGKWPQ